MKSLLTLPNGSVYAATYGHGIIKIHEEKKRNQLKVAEREDFPSFPPIPSIKTRDELNQEAVKLNQVVDEENNHKVKKSPMLSHGKRTGRQKEIGMDITAKIMLSCAGPAIWEMIL